MSKVRLDLRFGSAGVPGGGSFNLKPAAPAAWWPSQRMIYYVTVRDSAGRTRHAWVRCGGYFLGMLSDNMDVRWED